MRREAAAVALLAGLLTACEGVTLPFDLPFGMGSEPKAETASETPPQPAAPKIEPEAPPQPEIAALPPEPVIDDDPERIMGLGAAQLTELLGQPELTRREPPAEIWQYRGQSCVFDVFLYEGANGEADGRRVTYLEARDDSTQRVATRACLNQLLRARIAKPLG